MQEELFDLFTCILALLFPLAKHAADILLLMVLPFAFLKRLMNPD